MFPLGVKNLLTVVGLTGVIAIPLGLTSKFSFYSNQPKVDLKELQKYCPNPKFMSNPYPMVTYSIENHQSSNSLDAEVTFVDCTQLPF
ncbi:hypothetical protein OVS_02465 [Mycoplasma ovis str. Michigan]|uniref:Uncharacterized protein n=1 Tax=Mycoplasma ovis str. Michigan TaxID=1415773 RepID=A0ABM5P1G4_9MOLU|nr:hypothetical protein [Mycoplasma ovis]AHC40331.1 hypothetical protein OVS_02465 [Mycoplasma ovis str. Michigan]